MEEAITQPLPILAAPPGVQRRPRTWPPLLVLLFLSPIVGEVISGSTPPLRFLSPFSIIMLPTLYGISSLLIHEIMVRYRLGWGNVLLMGAAFGIFQEALVVQTWFNFQLPSSPAHSLGLYGVLWQTSWDWALYLTIYHAVVSITVPMLLIRLFFPRRSQLPWLGKKRVFILTAWLLLLCGILTWYIAFKNLASSGYTHPPLYPYLLAFALTAICFLLGAFLRFPPLLRPHTSKVAPAVWQVRLALFGLATVFFLVVNLFFPAFHVPAPITMLLTGAVFCFSLWRVASWSTRPGWQVRHQLAVATGIVMYLIFIFGPLVEFVSHNPGSNGLTLFNLWVFVGLMLFDRRLKKIV